jgi:anti-sigma factor RsiW
LSPGDGERLEEEFFVNDEIFQEIEIAEDDLVDDYVRGELSDNERRQFESKLAGLPRLAERIKFAHVLATRIESPSTDVPGLNSADKLAPVVELSKDDVDEPQNILAVDEPPKNGWKEWFGSWLVPQRIGALAGAMVLLIAGSFLVRDWLRLRAETKRLVTESEELKRQNQVATSNAETERRHLAVELKNAEAQNDTLRKDLENALAQVGTVLPQVPFLLYAGGSRDPASAGKDVSLPARPTKFVIWLALDSDTYPKYSAVVTRVGGSEIARAPVLRPSYYQSTKALKLQLSSTLLSRGNYVVTVNGVAPSKDPVFVGSYSFRMVDRSN